MKLKILLAAIFSVFSVSILLADTGKSVIRISPVWDSADAPSSDKWEKFTESTRTGEIKELWVSKEGPGNLLIPKEDIGNASVEMPSQKEDEELTKFMPEVMREALKQKPRLFISLKDSRKQALAQLTRENKGKRLAFFVNGKFISAPPVSWNR